MKNIIVSAIFSLVTLGLSAQFCKIQGIFGSATPIYNADNSVNPNYYIVPGKNDSFGICDIEGNMIVPALYSMYFIITNGQTIAKNYKKKIVELWDLTSKTKIKLPGINAGDIKGDNNFIALQMPNKKWGYCDSKGKIVIPGKFEFAEEFVNGRALVSTGSQYGMIDTKGKWVATPKRRTYKRIGKTLFYFSDETKTGDDVGIMDNEGKSIIAPKIYADIEYNNGFIKALKEDKSGVMLNYSGQQILANFKEQGNLSNLSEGLNGLISVISENGFMYLMDTLGNKFLQNKYYNINSLFNYDSKVFGDLYLVDTRKVNLEEEQKPEYKVVKKDGSILLSGPYSDVICINDNLFYTAVGNDENRLYTLKKADGSIVAKDICNEISGYLKSYATIKRGNKYGVINIYTAEEVVPATYINILSFSECSILFTKENGEQVAYNQQFKIIK